jgi:site-specific DNA recombinase
VQAVLARNGRSGGALVRNKFGALLKGLVRCASCGCAMTPAHSVRNGTRRYRYYVCSRAQKRGWDTCPTKSIPAGELERFVVDQIKAIGKDPTVLCQTFEEAQSQYAGRIAELHVEQRSLDRDLSHWSTEVHKLVEHGTPDSASGIARLAALQERIRTSERRVTEVNEELITLGQQTVNQDDVASALAVFDPVWESLTPHEQSRVVQLLVERIDYDGTEGKVSITFHPSGIRSLAEELSLNKEKIA